METVLVLLQAAGAVAALVGLWLALPPAWALTVSGLLVLVLATAGEAALRRAHKAPQNGRYGSEREGSV